MTTRTTQRNREYMREYRRRPGNLERHNEQTREWKRDARSDPDYRHYENNTRNKDVLFPRP